MPQWRLIVLAIILASAVSYHVYAVSRARADGVREERLVWQERQMKAIAQAEEARRVAQAKINEIENRYLAARQHNEKQLADLEAALEAEKEANDAPNPACPPSGMSRRLSNSLNQIGR